MIVYELFQETDFHVCPRWFRLDRPRGDNNLIVYLDLYLLVELDHEFAPEFQVLLIAYVTINSSIFVLLFLTIVKNCLCPILQNLVILQVIQLLIG